MAKKSKGFGEILRQEQWATAEGRSLAKLKRNVSSYGKDIKLVMNQGEMVKMSEVLEDFVSPYLEDNLNKHGLETLFSMGILAWNVAIMPVEKRIEMLTEAFSAMMSNLDLDDITFAKDLIKQMIDRKDKLFADNQRMIMSFELQYISRSKYHISVASTMPD